MDPILSTLLLSVLGNIASDLVKYPIRKIRAESHRAQERSAMPMGLVGAGVEKVSLSALPKLPFPIEEIALFLQSEEVAEVVRAVFSYHAYEEIGERRPIEIVDIRRSFTKEYEKFFDTACSAEESKLLDDLFDSLLVEVEGLMTGSLSSEFQTHRALEKLDELRTFKKLNEIQKSIRSLKREGRLKPREILLFEKQLRAQVVEVHGKVVPPSLGDTKKLDIDDVYVTPSFYEKELWATDSAGVGERIELAEFFENVDKTLVLGNPGAGKTTLTDKLCYELALNYESKPVGGKWLTPLHITLRKYAEAKAKSEISIAEFIERTVSSRYQLTPPAGAVQYMLINGRALTIFDGLDELLDVATRREIVSDIEAFLARYPEIRCLVTSREIGYGRAPLSENKFLVYKIAPFDADQTGEYIRKWFSLDNSLDVDSQMEKAARFAVESKGVRDLTSNPLMLSLMCLLYKGEGYIPTNRPDLYEKCSKMLFETWDRNRNIPSYTPFEDYFRTTLMYLAFWIYNEESNLRLQGKTDSEDFETDEGEEIPGWGHADEISIGFNEKLIIRIATEYLTDYFDTQEQAENYAQGLIDFCRNRAWVFTDVGEESYNFTHRTFLEYFAASYLVRTYKSLDEIANFLIPKIIGAEWLLVAQLALQIKNQVYDKAADEFVTRLLGAELGAGDREVALLFVYSCLEFINFSTQTRNTIFSTLREFLDSASARTVVGSFSSPNEFLASSFRSISRSSTANRTTLNRLLSEFLTGLVLSERMTLTKYAILFANDLPFLTDPAFIDKTGVEWTNIRLDVLKKFRRSSESSRLIESDFETALNLSLLEGVDPTWVLTFGPQYMTESFSLLNSRTNFVPGYIRLLMGFGDQTLAEAELDRIFEGLGSILRTKRSALRLDVRLSTTFRITETISGANERLRSTLKRELSHNVFLGLFWLCAVAYELNPRRAFEDLVGGTEIERLVIRRARKEVGHLNAVLPRLAGDEPTVNLVRMWIAGEVSFVYK